MRIVRSERARPGIARAGGPLPARLPGDEILDRDRGGASGSMRGHAASERPKSRRCASVSTTMKTSRMTPIAAAYPNRMFCIASW